MIGATFSAEILKLRKRPAVWVLAGVLSASVAVFGYLLLYVVVASGDVEGGPGFDAGNLLDTLLPGNVVATALGLCASPGGPVALILGALAVGGEYRWGTLKSIAIQRPGRGVLIAGKLLALGAVTLALALTVFVTAGLASALVAALEDAAPAAPPAADLVLGLGAAWLVLSLWAGIGAMLAVAFKGTGLAIGLGLVYALVLESLVAVLPLRGRAMDVIRDALIGPNVSALSDEFGSLAEGFGGPARTDLPEPWQAVAVLTAYLAVVVFIAAFVFRRRDVV